VSRSPRRKAPTVRKRQRSLPTRRNASTSRRTKRPAYRRAKGATVEVAQVKAVRAEIERLSRSTGPPRWNANPDDVQRSVVKLVLTLVEFLRQLMERQAIRRMEAGTITAEETEAIGLALMQLEGTVRSLGAQFDLKPEDLNLDLGVGKLI
jgi:hypothetical protein